MQEHEMSSIEEITEGGLESVTGGCGACAPDKKIRDDSFALVKSWQEKRAPAGTTSVDINNAINAGTAAMKRMDQRHSSRQQLPTIPENEVI